MIRREQFYLDAKLSARVDVYNSSQQKIYYLSPIEATIPKHCDSSIADGILFHGDNNIFQSIPIHCGGHATMRYIMLCNASGQQWIRYKFKVRTQDGKSCALQTTVEVDKHSPYVFKTTPSKKRKHFKPGKNDYYVEIN